MTDDTEFTPQEVRQTAGRSIAFNGRLLASTEFQTRLGKPRSLLLEVWETQGRAYVAVSRSEAIGGPDDSDVLDEARRVWAVGGEGLMLKDMEAPYRRDRNGAWLKVKAANAGKWRMAA